MEPDAPLLHTSEADTRHAVSIVSASASATALVGVVALSGCGGDSGGAPAAGVPTTTTPPTVAEASRFLGHAGFGGTDTSIAEVVTKGYSTWIADQIAMTRTQTHEAWLIQQGKSSTTSSTDGANSLLNLIVPSIQRTSDLVQEIAATSAEQSTSVAQVGAALAQSTIATQQNASASEELAATSEELSAQANQLQESISFFKTRATGRTSRQLQYH